MKNIITICLLLLLSKTKAQTFEQGIKLTIVEECKECGPRPPISNTEVEIQLNDSIQLHLKTDINGVIMIPLSSGKYKVLITVPECYEKTWFDVNINEKKTAYILSNMVCESYLNSLSKKEKKKLGYK